MNRQERTPEVLTPAAVACFVYFIQAESGGLIKIGSTANVAIRLKTLQSGCPVPLRILAVCPGHDMHERDLHRRFSGARRHGEWFDPIAELLDFIASLATNSNPFAHWVPDTTPQPRLKAGASEREIVAHVAKRFPGTPIYYCGERISGR